VHYIYCVYTLQVQHKRVHEINPNQDMHITNNIKAINANSHLLQATTATTTDTTTGGTAGASATTSPHMASTVTDKLQLELEHLDINTNQQLHQCSGATSA
jgi:H+/gluconate symporter-like permease